MTQTDTEPAVTSDAPPCWPPLAHLVALKDMPVKPGTIALCGAKLMGIDLTDTDVRKVCEKCCRIAQRDGLG